MAYLRSSSDPELLKRVRAVIRRIGSMNKAAKLFGVHRIALLAFDSESKMHSDTIERIRGKIEAAEGATEKEKRG
jgi:DNA-binding phage protein